MPLKFVANADAEEVKKVSEEEAEAVEKEESVEGAREYGGECNEDEVGMDNRVCGVEEDNDENDENDDDEEKEEAEEGNGCFNRDNSV